MAGGMSTVSHIIWRRTGSHNSAVRFGPIHDTILFYTKSDSYTWNDLRRPYMKGHVTNAFTKVPSAEFFNSPLFDLVPDSHELFSFLVGDFGRLRRPAA